MPILETNNNRLLVDESLPKNEKTKVYGGFPGAITRYVRYPLANRTNIKARIKFDKYVTPSKFQLFQLFLCKEYIIISVIIPSINKVIIEEKTY